MDDNNENFSDYDGILFNKEKSTLLLVPTDISGEHIIPDTVKSIGEGAFYSCMKLTKITLPEGLKDIPMLAFAGCVSLSEVVMPESLETIGDRAFAGCQAIKTLTIPENVSGFGTYVFTNSANITEILVEEGNKNFVSVDGVLFSSDQKTLVQYPLGRSGDYTVPDGTQRLATGSFFSANLLEKVTVPDSVTDYGNGGGTPLDTIVFGYPGGYPANLMIAAKKGSAAAQYAESMEIPFTELSDEKYRFKDVDTSRWYFDGIDYAVRNGLMKGVSDPWQIATAEQLNRVRDDLTAHYVLIDDIDLSGYENWMTIGTFRSLSDAPEDSEIPHPDYAFTGTFDGAGHTISNLNISSEAPIGAGLFGCVSGTKNGAANIGHFTLKNVNVSGCYLVGGAVGLQFMNCPVSDIHLVGDNKLTGMQGIGGIVGTGFDLISDCSATADITVQGDDGACAGLIAGGTTMSSIKNCEVTGGSITAGGNAAWGFGALCGAPWGAAEITDCKASGTVITVSGENNRLVGGLVGFGGTYDPAVPAQITGCTVENVNIVVSETTNSVGGLIGAGKEMMEGSEVMFSFSISGCEVSGSIAGGGAFVDAIVGDPACAVSVDCKGGMTVLNASDKAA